MADIVIADTNAVVITPAEAANIIEGQGKQIENLIDDQMQMIAEKNQDEVEVEKTESEILTWQWETTLQLSTMQTTLESLSASVAALLILPLLQTPNPPNADAGDLENSEVIAEVAGAVAEVQAEAEAEAEAPNEVAEQAPAPERKYRAI